MTVELHPLSTQMDYVLVVSLSDQAQEIVRNSPEGVMVQRVRNCITALVTMFMGQALETMRGFPEEMATEGLAQAGLKHEPAVGI